MNASKYYIIARKLNFWDYFCLILLPVGLVGSFLRGDIFTFLVLLGFYGYTIYMSRNGFGTIHSKTKLEYKNVYEVDCENKNEYILAETREEAELLCELEKFDGEIKCLGKVRFFK